ncbi:type I secretion C-terminal target domain-containing protein [Sinorhizobium meliloti]|nr:type I secretion C-terminal target domain-containing protein [Sinorhizobium meliloti]MDW9943957.1 type I secretion C-terminal target domain-containing protein [Sinorhizobium meliloti]
MPFTVDQTAPAAPAAPTSYADNEGSVQDPASTAATTDDTTPGVNIGTVPAGTTPSLYVDGVKVDATYDPVAGTLTPVTPLAEGAHQLTYTLTDEAGNESGPSGPLSVTVDTGAPAAPAITGANDDVAPVEGAIAPNGTTNDATPTLSGTAEAGSLVTIYDGTTPIGSVTADASGNWSFTPAATAPLSDGAHSLTATATDAAGLTSGPSAPLSFTVDTTSPGGSTGADAPVLSIPEAASGINAAELGDGIQTTVTLTAGTQAGDVITITATGATGTTTTTYTVTAADVTAGSAAVTLSGSYADGSYTAEAVITDAAGNSSSPSATVPFTVDQTAPAAPAITGATDNAPLFTGPIAAGSTTNDATPTLAGTGEAGTVVTVYDGTTAVGSATVAADGTWSVTTSTLTDGSHTLNAKLTDAAGNVSAPSVPLTFTVDATPPAAPTIVRYYDDTGLNQGWVTNASSITDDKRPQLEGQADANSIVTIYDGTTAIGSTTADATGYWSFTPTTNLSDAVHNITAKATDAAGNTSGASNTFAIQVYTFVYGLNPVITSFGDDAGTITGDFPAGTITDDTTPLLQGTVEGAFVDRLAVFEGGTYLGDADIVGETADGVVWEFFLSGVTEGVHEYTVKTVNSVGGIGQTSAPFGLTVDTTLPVTNGVTSTFAVSMDTAHGLATPYATTSSATNSDLVTRDTTLSFSGTLSAALMAGQYLQISGNGGTWTTVLQNSGTAWTYPVPGEYTASNVTTYALRIIDAAGNVAIDSGLVSRTVTVDLDAPAPISIAPVVSGSVTTATSVTFSSATYGTAEPGAIVALVNDVNASGSYQEGVDEVLAFATVATDGSWSITTTLSAGEKNLAFQVFDLAGNYSTLSASTSTTATSSANTGLVTQSWGGTTDAEGNGLNAAAVTISSDGLWSFAQSVRGTSGSSVANALRVYSETGLTTYSSAYLAEPAGVSGNLDGHYISAMTFGDYDRDGDADVFGQVTDSDSVSSIFVTAMWRNNGGSYTPIALGIGPDEVDMGGVIAYDKNGDGYLDFVFAATDTADEGGFLLNSGGTLGFDSPDAVADGINSNTSLLFQLSGVDIDNNGTIDIAAHTDQQASGSFGYSRTLSVFINNGITFTTALQQNYYNVFRIDDNSGNDDGNRVTSMTWADFNGDGWLDLYLNMGGDGTTSTSTSSNSNQSRIYLNDGAGHLSTASTSTIWFGDNLDGRTSLAVDWNHDGRMDVIELPGQNADTPATAFAPTLWTNNGGNAYTSSSLTGTTYNTLTGAAAVDYNWDGAKDLILYRPGADSAVTTTTNSAPTLVVYNTNAVEDGTSLQIRILDGQGINAFYGNTVKLYNSAGTLVATQVINAQSSGSNDSTGIVSFYGLNPNETYSVQMLRITNGVANHVGADLSSGGYVNTTVNATWGGLTTGEAHDAYVLTAESGSAINNTISAITGTGYNDTFSSSAGNDTYNGSGGWSSDVASASAWSATGGMDVLDFSRASAAVTINLAAGTAVGAATGSDTLISIEGITGTAFADTMTDNGADNRFDGRGGNDHFILSGGGRDTILYSLLDGADPAGGNGRDAVSDFTVGDVATNTNADVLDLSALLSGYSGTAGVYVDSGGSYKLDAASSGLRAYLSTEVASGNTAISIDRDGSGTTFSPTIVVTLQNVTTDLETLLANQQIVV